MASILNEPTPAVRAADILMPEEKPPVADTDQYSVLLIEFTVVPSGAPPEFVLKASAVMVFDAADEGVKSNGRYEAPFPNGNVYLLAKAIFHLTGPLIYVVEEPDPVIPVTAVFVMLSILTVLVSSIPLVSVIIFAVPSVTGLFNFTYVPLLTVMLL